MASIRQRLTRFRQWQQDPSRHIAKPSDERHCCPCCGADYAGNFCPQCGQKANVGRITWKTVRQGFSMLWGMDSRSLPYTLWQLLLRPGYLIGDYISGKRQVSFPPIKMLALVAVFVFLVSSATEPEEESQTMPYYLIFNYLFLFFEKHLDMGFLFFFSFLIVPTYFTFRFSPRHPRHNLPEGLFIEVFNSTLVMLVMMVVSVIWYSFSSEAIEDHALILILMAMLLVSRSYHQLFGYGRWATLWRTMAVFLAAGQSLGVLMATDNIISLAVGGKGDLAFHRFTHRFIPLLLGTLITISAAYFISRRTAKRRAK